MHFSESVRSILGVPLGQIVFVSYELHVGINNVLIGHIILLEVAVVDFIEHKLICTSASREDGRFNNQ